MTPRRCGRSPSAALFALTVAGCVVVDERPSAPAPIAAVPVAIPFADAQHQAQPVDAYYDSVLTQMQQAWLQNDASRLSLLLQTHERPDAPDWARDRVASFRRVLEVMGFEALVHDHGQLDLPAPLPALGERLALTVRLGPMPSVAVSLPGGNDPLRARFVLLLQLIDLDSFGTQMENAVTRVVDLPQNIDFAAGEAVRVPVEIDVPAQNSVLRRVLIDVFLMPGHVELQGARLPNRRVRCARAEVELLPHGHDRIAAQPLAALQAALRLGDAAHFPHVFLAARAIGRSASAGERELALAALIDRIRLGQEGQMRNAMAALAQILPDAAATCHDREQWLQWWSGRPAARR